MEADGALSFHPSYSVDNVGLKNDYGQLRFHIAAAGDSGTSVGVAPVDRPEKGARPGERAADPIDGEAPAPADGAAGGRHSKREVIP